MTRKYKMNDIRSELRILRSTNSVHDVARLEPLGYLVVSVAIQEPKASKTELQWEHGM